MTTRDEYVAKMKKQLDEVNEKLDQLAAKSERARTEVKTRYRSEMLDLRTQARRANDKLDEIKTAGENSWDSSVAEMEKISNALKHSYNYLRSQL
jgi:phage shock protein A